jgi:ABC-type sugar transport system ATPase subunit
MLDLDALLDRLPRQLSGGQRQRVAMGRALVREPSVSLLDEPLSNLDAKLRVEVRADIAELQHRTGTTMIYVTHDQTEAMTLGHRIAVLDKGVLQQVAPPRELYAQPANVFVAAFIGNPPMNVFPVDAVRAGERLQLTVEGQSIAVAAPGLAAALGSQPRHLRAGVRPEAFALADGDGLAARIGHVEFLGHETLLYASLGALRLVARLPGMQRFTPGDPIRLAADPAQLHLFDESGAALR